MRLEWLALRADPEYDEELLKDIATLDPLFDYPD
jgi:hypothetical protein